MIAWNCLLGAHTQSANEDVLQTNPAGEKKINAIFLILFEDTRLFEQWTVTQRAKVVMVDGERVPF